MHVEETHSSPLQWEEEDGSSETSRVNEKKDVRMKKERVER